MIDSSALLLIGAIVATVASLLASRGGARLALAALPFGMGLTAVLDSSALDLWGWSTTSGELLSTTLKLDIPGEGLKVLNAPLHVRHPFSGWLGYAWSVLGAFSIITLWAKRESFSRLALGAWAGLAVMWVLAAPVGGFFFTGGIESGETALRDWFMLSQNLEADRLSAFTLPSTAWQWSPHRLALVLIAGASALIGALLPSRERGSVPQLEGGMRALYQLGAILVLVGMAWQLSNTGGFVGAAPSWVALISLTVGGLLAHSASQAATLSLLALVATVL